MKSCQTCRFWHKKTEPDEQGLGVCGMIHEDSGLFGGPYLNVGQKDPPVTLLAGHGGLDLFTPADFFCSLFEVPKKK